MFHKSFNNTVRKQTPTIQVAKTQNDYFLLQYLFLNIYLTAKIIINHIQLTSRTPIIANVIYNVFFPFC